MNLILETDRLILRELLLSDAEAFFAMDANPNVHKYLWNKPTQKIEETIQALQRFLTPKGRFGHFYSDAAGELFAAAKAMGLSRDSATQGRPESNGVAENKV